jgi:hypothetical protein
MVAKTVKEQTGMLLAIHGASGNPVRGYTFNGITLASAPSSPSDTSDTSDTSDQEKTPSDQETTLFSAQTLQASINFASLFRASPRLARLAVSGVEMDLDRFVEEISKIQFQSSSDGGELPIDRVSLLSSRFTSKWGAVDVTEIEAAINGSRMNVTLNGAVNAVPVKGIADVDIQQTAVGVNKAELRLGKGLVTTSGNVGLTGAEGVPLDFQGSITGLDVSELTAFWPDFLSTEDYDGNLNLSFTVEGAGSNLLIAANVAFKGSKLGGYPVETIDAQLRYANTRLSAENVRVTSLGIPIEGEAALAVRDNQTPSVMIKLRGGDTPLAELAKLYPGLGKVGGKVERFSVNIQGPTNALSGAVELSAPNILLLGKRIENFAVQIKLAKSDKATLNGKFVLEGSQAYIQGTIGSILTSANLDLTAKLLNLDIKKVDDLIPDGKKYGLAGLLTADLAIKGKPTSPSLSGSLSSPKFTAAGYTLDKPSLSFAYDKDRFTLRKSSGSWNGLPIEASGTLGPLSSSTPTIDMTAQLAFKPENLKQFVPDLADYKLQGTINAGVRIRGNLPQPQIDLLASSPALSAFGLVDAKNLEISTALAGDLTKLDKVDLSFKAASIAAGGVGLQNLSALLRKNGQQVRLENVSAKSGEGSVRGGGTVAMGSPGKDASLNLAFEFQQLDLAPLARTGGLGVDLTGVLSGKASVTGPSSNPAISFTAQVPSVSVEGVALTGLAANLSGNTKTIKINEFKANLGGAPLSAKGTVSLTDPFGVDIDVAGDGLDLAALMAGMPDLKGQVTGKTDLKLAVKSTSKGVSGAGSLRSTAVTAFGIKTSNLSFPLSLEWFSGGGSVKSTGGALDLYGGKVSNNLTFDLKSLKFSDTLKVSGVDVNTLVQDAAGGLSGKITGKGNLSLKIDGSAAGKFSYSGSGQFDMGEGSITGFSGLNLLSALYGVEGIRYTKVTAPLRLAMDKLVVGKGTSVVPPANDPVYKSAKLAEDGVITFDKKINFTADLNVNFQLINALLGGATSGIEALLKGGNLQNVFSGKNLESALKGAISGGREQSKEADFRDVTVKVAGTFEKPSISLGKVGPSSTQAKEKPAASPAVSSENPVKPEDILKEKIIDVIIPTKKPDTVQPRDVQESQNQNSQQGEQSPKSPEKQIEKQIEEEVQNQLRKGLDNLFKKR